MNCIHQWDARTRICINCGITLEASLRGEAKSLYVSDVLEGAEPFKVPDSIEPIVAWRAWNVKNNQKLYSMNGSFWHPAQAMEATCARIRHGLRGRGSTGGQVPVENCTCGIYAANDFSHAAKYLETRVGVIGEVYLWGKVITAVKGYRAQYAFPKCLWYVEELDIGPTAFVKLDRDFPNWVQAQENERLKEQYKPVIPYDLSAYGVPVEFCAYEDFGKLCLRT